MTIQEARRLLGVTPHDDHRTIKQKFRKLILTCHPDVVGSHKATHVKRAQLLNEAYAVLNRRELDQKAGRNPAQHSEQTYDSREDMYRAAREASYYEEVPLWDGEILEYAYTERIIYLSDDTWEDRKTYYYQVAKGRYEWNPDDETFDCLIKSLHQAVLTLLEAVEHKYGSMDAEAFHKLQFEYQMKIFHLLAGQFIPPIKSLNRMVLQEQTNVQKHVDDQGRSIYGLQTLLGTKGRGDLYDAMAHLKAGDPVYARSIKHNRIMMRDGQGHVLGHLSMEDDRLYYVVIPILQHKKAQVKFVVRRVEAGGRGCSGQIKVWVDLYLRMEKDVADVNGADYNQQIRDTLQEYDVRLGKI